MQSAPEMLKDYHDTAIHFGDGIIDAVGDKLKGRCSRALIVMGGGSARSSGALGRLTASLESAGIEAESFEGVEPNPSIDTVHRIAGLLKDDRIDKIVALGGGSAIDASKAAQVVATYGAPVDQYFGVGRVTERRGTEGPACVPIAAVPTTSGSGAEVTLYSSITDPAKGLKKLIVDECIIPDHAFVDPGITHSCPPALTATVALDALCHLIEGYLNTIHDDADPGANDRALAGIELIARSLGPAFKEGANTSARRDLSAASVLGGTVIRFKSTALPHMFSFSWSEVLSHGDACALALPYAWAYYLGDERVMHKSARVARALGVRTAGLSEDASALLAIEAFSALKRSVGHPDKIEGMPGSRPEMIERAVRDAAENEMKLLSAPRPVPSDRRDVILQTIIEGAYYGRIEPIYALG